MTAPPRLDEGDYLRQRRAPAEGDVGYLCHSDLRLALDSVSSSESLRVLDFGSGGSPYRELFPNADFRRADVPGVAGLDYEIDDSGRVPEQSGAFDLVLSTQVLEHLESPVSYLREASRLLRAGGRLVCSTHGSFPDHACPQDYRRWTSDGLKLELREAGFEATQLFKTTTGPRAVFFLLEEFAAELAAPRRTLFGLSLWVLRSVLGARRASLHRLLDRHFRAHRVVPAGEEGHRLYVALLCVAVKQA